MATTCIARMAQSTVTRCDDLMTSGLIAGSPNKRQMKRLQTMQVPANTKQHMSERQAQRDSEIVYLAAAICTAMRARGGAYRAGPVIPGEGTRPGPPRRLR